MDKIFEFAKNNITFVIISAAIIAVVAAAVVIFIIARKRRFAVDIGASKHIGARRYQQDAYFVPEKAPQKELHRKGYLCVLCDGMGGLDGGDIASSLCVNSFSLAYYDKTENRPVNEFFEDEINMLDEKVCEISDEYGRRLRAGTTIVCALVKNRKLYWASTGDSRIYLFKNKSIVQITRDHNYALTLAQDVKDGLKTAEEAESDPDRDSLISFIGMEGISLIDIDAKGIDMKKGDAVLLCSDGLYHSLTENEMVSVLHKHINNAKLAAHVLMAKAFDKNIPYQDNMSVVVMISK